jgi:hypothetical protein
VFTRAVATRCFLFSSLSPFSQSTMESATTATTQESTSTPMKVDYEEEINYMVTNQCKNQPQHGYLSKRRPKEHSFTITFRNTTVDWILQMMDCEDTPLRTVIHAVSILDRFLNDCHIPRDKIQAMACACLMIAEYVSSFRFLFVICKFLLTIDF